MNITQDSKQISILRDELSIAKLNEIFKKENVIRFAIVESDDEKITCEYGIADNPKYKLKNLFEFKPRKIKNEKKFNVAMIVPTGIGAEIGGDSGDANVAAKLIGSVCDTLITHPNVVNAADINEMTSNTLYVEGSILARLLMGTVGLNPVHGNRILLIYDKITDQTGNMVNPEKKVEKYIENVTVNTASAARVTLGNSIDVYQMEELPVYKPYFNEKGMAVGKILGIEKLLDVINKHKENYDAFALHTIMEPDDASIFEKYFNDELDVNPWGGLEAAVTHTISSSFDVPTAHAPMLADGTINYEYGIVDPAKSPETLSKTELFCVLKGLSKSPKIITDETLMSREYVLTNEDINCLIIPDRCIGLPVLAALEQGITVIAVDDKRNIMKNDLDKLPWKHNQFFRVSNYIEAAGMISCLKMGMDPIHLSRPLLKTKSAN